MLACDHAMVTGTSMRYVRVKVRVMAHHLHPPHATLPNGTYTHNMKHTSSVGVVTTVLSFMVSEHPMPPPRVRVRHTIGDSQVVGKGTGEAHTRTAQNPT